MFSDGTHFMGGMRWLCWLFWLALIGVMVFYGWGRPDARRRSPHQSPHEVLKQRLAKGDIPAEEYEQRKALLDRDAGSKT